MMSAGDSAKVHDAHGPEAFTQLLGFESDAERILLCQPLYIPGLLQRAGYAAGILSGVAGLQTGSPELAERVELRLRRAGAFEQRLRGARPPHLTAVLDEGALRRRVGGAEAMREQLAHLITMSGQETVHLSIIPFGAGAHPGQLGTFELHERPDGEAALFFERSSQDEFLVSDVDQIRSHRAIFESITASSITGQEARHMLEKISGEL